LLRARQVELTVIGPYLAETRFNTLTSDPGTHRAGARKAMADLPRGAATASVGTQTAEADNIAAAMAAESARRAHV
jgi:hypothetical protein